MSRTRVVLTVALAALAPSLAEAFELEVELVPGRPARTIVLPAGVAAEAVEVVPTAVELESQDPTPQPATRTFFVAGYPVTVARAIPRDAVRTRTARVGGREVLLVEAERLSAAGEVASVRATVRVPGPSAGAGRLLPPAPGGFAPVLPEPAPVLAIVSTERIVERSRSLARYVRWREAGGLRVVLGTEEQWDRPVASGPDRRAERIRAWLRQVRDDHGLGYVLLVGDPSPRGGSVPMQLTHPLSELVGYYPPELAQVLDPVPTDHFYADLDGDWDVDRDGRYGEYPDDLEGLRWGADALVGRIPVYGLDTAPLDAVLDSVIDYESSPSPAYRARALLAAAFIGFAGSPAPGGGEYEETNDGAVAAEVLREAVLALDPRAEVLRFYEEAGIWPSAFEHERPLERESLVAEWARGAGIFVAFAHGSTDGDYRTAWLADRNDDGLPGWEELLGEPFLTSADSRALEGAGRAFTFHAACENGWPEDSRNLAASLLRQGAIGSVAASRAAIGGDVEFEPDPSLGDADTLAFAFVHLLLEGATAGQAMAYLRYGLPADGWGTEWGIPLNGYGWLGKLEYNLYGDPVARLGRCETDSECSDGSLCNGEGRCLEGYCVQGELVDCSALAGTDQCTVGACEPSTGTCSLVAREDGARCDDGLYCTVEDTCGGGLCAGAERSCGEAPDGFVARCDEASRACLLEPETGSDAGPGLDAEVPGAPRFGARGGGCSASGRGGSALRGVLGALLP